MQKLWKHYLSPKANIYKELQKMHVRSESLKQRIEVILRMFPELHDDEEMKFDTLDGETEIKSFLQRCVLSAMIYDSEADATQTTIEKLQFRKARFKKRVEFYRLLIQDIMNTADMKKIELPEATLTIQNSPSKVVITDESKLPDEVFKITKTVDKIKLKDLLKDGPILGAELSNGGQMLVVR